MRYAFALLAFLALSGCIASGSRVTSSVADPALYAGENLWGTDAYLTPSKPDAILRYGSGKRAFAELRLPQGKGPFPLAVIYHGGCWKVGVATQAYMAPLATHWQQMGIATLNVDYREVGDGGGWPGSFEDWQASSGLIDEVAAEYPIDRTRVTLVGHSAGAAPAQWLAAEQGDDGPVGARPPLAVYGAIIFDGQGDVALDREPFDGLCGFPAVDPFMGGAPDAQPVRYAAISAVSHPPHLAHVLFVQAVLPPPAEAMQTAMRKAGTQMDIRSNAGASHFAIITPGGPVYAANEPAMLKLLRGE